MSKNLLIQKSMKNVKTFLVSLALVGMSVSSFTAFAQHPPLGGGSGTQADPYQIATPAQLADLATFANAGNGYDTYGVYYKLMNDIDLSSYASGEGWKPIGDANNGVWLTEFRYCFQGRFDGCGYVIKNLTINRTTDIYVGLFGYVKGGKIKNLGIENCNVSGEVQGFNYTGGLAAWCNLNMDTISNCYVVGTVKGGSVGGLIGNNDYSTVVNCYFNGNMQTGYPSGGLIGQNYYSRIVNCYTLGNLEGCNGGLVGTNSGSSISNCFSKANTGFGENNRVGGLVGENGYNSTITNCYATGNVIGYNESAGGLVGWNAASKISNCYATGNVRLLGGTGSGGLVGLTTQDDITNSVLIANCIAANDSVILEADNNTIHRVLGLDSQPYIPATFENNYAYKDMVVKDINGDVSITDSTFDADGIGVDMATFKTLAFYATASNWYNNEAWDIDTASASSSVWRICEGKSLPWLRWENINCDAITTHTITATAGSNGSISPSGAVSVTEGNSQTFTFTANSNYEIDQVLIDNVNNPAAVTAGTYTFENVTADHSIAVSFKETVGIVTITNYELRITIYPNPTDGKLRITNYELREGTVIEICNVVGQIVFTSAVSALSPETTIDISHLANGMYYLKINEKTVKFVKN